MDEDVRADGRAFRHRLENALVQQVLAASDEEVLAQCRADNEDPRALADQVQRLLAKAIGCVQSRE